MAKKQRFPLFPGTLKFFSMAEKEIFPEIEKTGHLKYSDEGGKIRIGCYFGSDLLTFDLGLVPDDIANQGRDAVCAYAESKKNTLIAAERQRRADRDRRIVELHQEYTISFRGVAIRGFVRKDRDEGARANFMKLTLTEPYQLECLLYVSPQCWADAAAGNQSFDDDGFLTKDEQGYQRGLLKAMYLWKVVLQHKPKPHPTLTAFGAKDAAEEVLYDFHFERRILDWEKGAELIDTPVG